MSTQTSFVLAGLFPWKLFFFHSYLWFWHNRISRADELNKQESPSILTLSMKERKKELKGINKLEKIETNKEITQNGVEKT